MELQPGHDTGERGHASEPAWCFGGAQKHAGHIREHMGPKSEPLLYESASGESWSEQTCGE